MLPIFNLLGFLCLCAGLIYLLRAWVLDILFYKRNGWDFTKDSGRFIYPSAGPFQYSNIKPMGNRAKLFFGFPFFIVGCAAATIIVYLFDVRGKW